MQSLKLVGDYIKEGGKTIGKIYGHNIKDAGGRTIAKIDRDKIRDSSGRIIGRIYGSYLKDSSGKNLSRMDQIHKEINGEVDDTTLAAIWLLFTRNR